MSSRFALIASALSLSLILLTSMSVAYAESVNIKTAQSDYSTYVIETYGGSALMSAVEQQLQAVGGGSVSVYQDKLIVRTTPAGYQAVQQLLSQIDHAPIPLTVSVRVGATARSTGSTHQGRVTVLANKGFLSNNGSDDRLNAGSVNSHHNYRVEAYGGVSNQSNQHLSNSSYQVNTLSGYSARIGTNTLLSLVQSSLVQSSFGQPYSSNSHDRRPIAKIRINQQVLLDTSKGIAVTPTLLPNNRVQVSIEQVEDRLTGNRQLPVQSQRLATTLMLPRGQWVSIGEISQLQQQYGNGGYSGGGSHSMNSSVNYPIQIKVE